LIQIIPMGSSQLKLPRSTKLITATEVNYRDDARFENRRGSTGTDIPHWTSHRWIACGQCLPCKTAGRESGNVTLGHSPSATKTIDGFTPYIGCATADPKAKPSASDRSAQASLKFHMWHCQKSLGYRRTVGCAVNVREIEKKALGSQFSRPRAHRAVGDGVGRRDLTVTGRTSVPALF